MRYLLAQQWHNKGTTRHNKAQQGTTRHNRHNNAQQLAQHARYFLARLPQGPHPPEQGLLVV
eukprot:scaffold22904_cov41-Cyclotella_meneghiniana.AAC.1